MKTYETERFVLKQLGRDRACEMFEILGNEKIIENLNMPLHRSPEDSAELIAEYYDGLSKKEKFPYEITDKKTGEFLGVFLIKLDLYDEDCFEFTVYINEKHHRRGIYTEVLPYMTRAAFEVAKTGNFRGFVMDKNEASKKVLSRAGFKLEKVFDVPGLDGKIFSYLMTREEYLSSRLSMI